MEFDDNAQHILAMKSLDGEVVPLLRKVKIMPEVEVCQHKYIQMKERGGLFVSLFSSMLSNTDLKWKKFWMIYLTKLAKTNKTKND